MTIFLTSVALMINGVGVARKPVIKSKNEYNPYKEDHALCDPINLNVWYLLISSTAAIKLVFLIVRYLYYKQSRQESISAYLIDLLIVNGMLTGVFIKANFMYFSEDNRCSLVEDGLI